jgi:hypothetical protein
LAGLEIQGPDTEGALDIEPALRLIRFTKAGLEPVVDVGPYFNLTAAQLEAWETDLLDHIPNGGVAAEPWIAWLGHVLTAAQAGHPALDTEAKVKAAMGIAQP